MSIRGKLYLSSIAVVLPLIVVAIVTVNLARDALRDGVRDGLASIADIARDRIHRQLETNENRLDDVRDADSDLGRATATLIDVWRRYEGHGGAEPDREIDVAGPLDEVSAELARLVAREPELAGVLLYAVDDDGTGVPVLPTPSDDAIGFTVVSQQPLRVVYTDARNHGSAVGAAYEDDGERYYLQAVGLSSADRDGTGASGSGSGSGSDPMAVLVARWRLESVVSTIDAAQIGETAETYLVQATATNDAELISDRPGRAEAFAGEVAASYTDTDALEIRALSGRAETSAGVVDDAGREVIAALRSIEGSNWALVVKVDEAEAFAGVNRAVHLLVLSFVVAVSLVIISSTLLGRSVIKRLHRVTDLARAFSNGDLAQRAGDDSSDELGVLAQAFDTMAARIEGDLDAQKKLGALLEHQALHDDLTGLPNRLALTRELSRTMETSSELTVLFCDLDEFKAVNDELGHSAGDELLRQVAARFADVLEGDDELGRFGGDEFIVLRRGAVHPTEAEDLAERLCRSLDTSIPVAGRDVFITVSIGIASSYDGAGATPDSLLRDADTAMYRAKELGKARHVTLDATTRARAATRLSAAMDLRRAIEDDDLVLYYQPIVDLSTGEILSVEALVRWPRASGAWVMPGEFISLAEASGLARSLDRWVIDRACRQLREWMNEAARSSTTLTLSMSVNVSTVGLGDGTLGSDVSEALDQWAIPPDRLCVEITEGALVGDPADTALTIGELKKIGVRLAIDDFGTGHSSLDRLRRLPIDVLKMDMTFVRDIDDDPSARAIAGAVANLGNTLGVDVVAEGVERVTQYHTLWNLGCRSGQGYWFGRPMAAPDLLQLVRDSDSEAWLRTVQPPDRCRAPDGPSAPAGSVPAAAVPTAAALGTTAPGTTAPATSVPAAAAPAAAAPGTTALGTTAPATSSPTRSTPGPISWTGAPIEAAAASASAAVPAPMATPPAPRPSPPVDPSTVPSTDPATAGPAPTLPVIARGPAGDVVDRRDEVPPLFVAKAIVDVDAKQLAARRRARMAAEGADTTSMLGWDDDAPAPRAPVPPVPPRPPIPPRPPTPSSLSSPSSPSPSVANGRAGRAEIARALVGTPGVVDGRVVDGAVAEPGLHRNGSELGGTDGGGNAVGASAEEEQVAPPDDVLTSVPGRPR